MKHITNKTKTILFASLIAAMILPFSGMQFAEAKQDKNNDVNKLQAYERKLAYLQEKALRDNKIDDKELVERVGKNWESQYESKTEFDFKQNQIKSYVTSDLEENGWNEFMIKGNVRIHNFDTIIGKTGSSHEIVGLIAGLEKIQETYAQPEPVIKFHDWIAQQYNIPTTENAIEERITEIVGDSKYRNISSNIYKSFNDMAQNGNVPSELFDEDMAYWNVIINISFCQFDDGCNVDVLNEILETKSYEREVTEIPDMAQTWLDLVLPKAFAWSETSHSSYVYGHPYACDYGTCKVSTSKSFSTGEHSIYATSPSWPQPHGKMHGVGNTSFKMYGSSCGSPSAYHSVVVETEVGYRDSSVTDGGYGCGIAQKTFRPSTNPHSVWTWTTTATTNAWLP